MLLQKKKIVLSVKIEAKNIILEDLLESSSSSDKETIRTCQGGRKQTSVETQIL